MKLSSKTYLVHEIVQRGCVVHCLRNLLFLHQYRYVSYWLCVLAHKSTRRIFFFFFLFRRPLSSPRPSYPNSNSHPGSPCGTLFFPLPTTRYGTCLAFFREKRGDSCRIVSTHAIAGALDCRQQLVSFENKTLRTEVRTHDTTLLLLWDRRGDRSVICPKNLKVTY